MDVDRVLDGIAIGRALAERHRVRIANDHAVTLGGKVPQHDLKFGWKARIVADPQDRMRRQPLANSTRFAKAFDVHDVFLAWTPQDGQFAGWQAEFGVDNIFDRQYKEFLHNDAAKGRTFKVSLSKQFGWQ